MNQQHDKNSIYASLGIYGACGFQLAISVVAGLLLGGWIDKKCGVSPIFAMIGLILGFGGGLWNLVRILNWHRDRP